jgi:hypothetical protein
MSNDFIEFILKNIVRIFFLGLGSFGIVQLFMNRNILLKKRYLTFNNYQFWLFAMIPAVGYYLVNMPSVFNSISHLGGKLSITSLFPFIICQIIIPVLITFGVNLFVKTPITPLKAIVFALPTFLIHIDHLAQKWFVPLLYDLQHPDSPITKITVGFVKMESLMGLILFMSIISVCLVGTALRKPVS